MTDHDSPTVLLEDDYLSAARELRDISREQKKLAEREKACKEILAKHLKAGEVGVDLETGARTTFARPSIAPIARATTHTPPRSSAPSSNTAGAPACRRAAVA